MRAGPPIPYYFSRKNWRFPQKHTCMQVRKETAEIRKDTEELKSFGNKQTENINNVDTRLTERMDRIQKIVEDFVAE